jgi:glycosyltransferase involved in cell wall biosynthesis
VRLTVAPLRFGAGIKGKVLDSFAAGLPCVMTPIAAEGLPLTGTLSELVADTPAAFADLVLRFHDDTALNEAASREASQWVTRNFAQEKVNQAFRQALFGASAKPGESSLSVA